MTNWLTEKISSFTDRKFLIEKDKIYYYKDLAEQIEYLKKKFLNYNIKSADIVILNGDYNLTTISSMLALFEIKAIVAPISSDSLIEKDIRIKTANAKWEISIKDDKTDIKTLESINQKHPYIEKLSKNKQAGLILFSSGSSGKPKAMVHSYDLFLEPFRNKRTKNLSILIFLLFDHIGGLNTLFNSLSTGSKIIVAKNKLPEEVAKTIEKHKANLLPASPTFLNLLSLSGVVENYDLSSLRYITYGTEPMPDPLLNRLKKIFPNTKFIQTFGTSETGISKTSTRYSKDNYIKFNDPYTEHKIVEGELWLRSKSQILGYLNHEMSKFTNDGWFKTGDLVELAEDDFLKIIGRKQEIINVGGEKVTPLEIESTLLEIPEIKDCLVYGEKNLITGQIVVAEVVLKSNKDPSILKRAIKNYCREKLSSFKVPAKIIFKEYTSFSNRFKKIRIKSK